MTYSAPKISELGSVRDFTLAAASFNKVGISTDFASQTIPSLVGSLVPAQP